MPASQWLGFLKPSSRRIPPCWRAPVTSASEGGSRRIRSSRLDDKVLGPGRRRRKEERRRTKERRRKERRRKKRRRRRRRPRSIPSTQVMAHNCL
ncbi:hypothetical protein LEMLEM_LOCUS25899 [Lemmus lemmus]